MMNSNQSQVALVNARQELKDTLERVKELRVKVKNLRIDASVERSLARIVREDERKLRAQKRAEKRAAKIVAMEQRLAEMRMRALAPKQVRKANRKASAGVVYSPEQIAALNAERGLI
jgi:D-alanine-D-alanine ligase-like ATP-grasp enzyme